MGQVLEAPSREAEEHHHHEHDVAVAVITPAGIYPSEDELRRVPGTEVIETTLKAAAEKLHLTNTSDWVARVHEPQDRCPAHLPRRAPERDRRNPLA